MSDPEEINTRLAIQALQQEQKGSRKVLDKVSDSLEELISMQKSHEIFHAKVSGKFEKQEAENISMKNRIVQLETSQRWGVRIVLTAVALKLLSMLWTMPLP